MSRVPQPSEAANQASFWEKVDLLGSCWTWTGAASALGYGHYGYRNKTFSAHRCAYEYSVGPVPDGLFVCHRCDNPSCVNPAHLYAGTAKQNTADMHERGRAPRVGPVGSKNSHAVLAAEDVLEIRLRFAAGGVTPKELAAEYGIDSSHVNAILTGRTWRSVGGPICTEDRRGRHGNQVRGANHPKSRRQAA